MCGIFGILLPRQAQVSFTELETTMARLYQLSESRGKESAGVHAYFPESGDAFTLKAATPASVLLSSKEYRELTEQHLRKVFAARRDGKSPPVALIAHSRLVTNGAAELPQNNQPVQSGPVTMIHNGIVVNVDTLWQAQPELRRHAEVDTEVMAAMIADAIAKGNNPAQAMASVYAKILGAASVAWVHDQGQYAVLATNTGDLYYAVDPQRGFLIFASERFILESALNDSKAFGNTAVEWLAPGRALVVDLNQLTLFPFAFALPVLQTLPPQPVVPAPPAMAALPPLLARPSHQHDISAVHVAAPTVIVRDGDEKLLRYNEARLRSLRRCSRCVLPETFPFIAFDEQGVCNYCHSYTPRYRDMDPEKTKREFIQSLQHYRSNDGSPDMLVPFSGGRDSSYGLHLIKKEFGFNPITFTYDWGMVTDLARRNVARMCGRLGVQNILVSADIAEKRENIRKNVAAWLHAPDLGLVPLFMAGDKHFFSIVNQLKRQTGIKLDVWSANLLEVTEFKTGFCGVSPDFARKRLDNMSLDRKVRMALYYASRFLSNPRYLNSSLLDTAKAFFAYYFEPRRDFYYMFAHILWNENEVNQTLRDYDWELAPDTASTWRIGDGTAPFYNYVYVTARGFCEFDTFRSNQIREGMITREFALESVLTENRPRPSSIRWYLDTIGIDFNQAIRRVNELDTLGLHQ